MLAGCFTGDADTKARHRLVIETAARIVSKVAWANRPCLRALKSSDYFAAMSREVIALATDLELPYGEASLDFQNERRGALSS